MGASGKKQLEVILNYRDHLSGRSGRTIKALASIESQAKRATTAVNLLNKALGRSGGGSSSTRAGRLPADLQLGTRLTRQLTAEMQRGLKVETQQVRLQREQARLRQDNVRLAKEESRALEAGARAQRAGIATETADLRLLRERIRLQRDADRLMESRARRRSPFFDGIDRARSGVGAVRDFYHAGRTAYDTAKTYADPAVEQMRARSRFSLMGFPEDERAQAFAAVERVSAEVKGVRQVDVQEVMTGLVNTVGTVREAVELLPLAAKHLATTEALAGGPEARAEAIKQFTTTAKALELLGKDQDMGEMQKYMNIVAQAGLATGGDINANEFRAFAKYANIAAPGMTPEGLRKYLPLLSQMGGARSGTALMTLYSNMVGGRIPAHKLRYWEELGLLDKSKVEFNKNTGQVQRLRPGAIPIAEGLGRDPVDVADKLTQVFKKKGIDVTSYDSVNKQLMSMFGDRTGAGALAQMINYRAALDKEARNYERAASITSGYDFIFDGKNPLGNFVKLDAARNDARAAAGMPVAQAGGDLAGYLARALDYARGKAHENPTAAAATVGVLSLGKASAEAADGVSQFGEVLRGLKGTGGGGGGGIAGRGVDGTDAAAGGYFGLRALKMGGRAGAALLGALWGPAAIAMFGGGSMYALHEQYKYDTETRRKTEGDAGTGFEAIKRRREEAGGRLPDDVARELSARAFPGVDRRGLLNELDVKTYGTAGYPGVMARPQYDRDALLAGGFARRAPELQFPELMRGFLDDIRGRVQRGEMAQAPADRLVEIAGKAFPESFKAATAGAEAELAKLTPAATASAEALKKVAEPAVGMASSLNEAQSAALSFASRVNSIDVRASIVLPPAGGGATAGGAGAAGKGRKFGFDFLNPFPTSAVGSVVEGDGLVSLHKGNVVFPAALSRRSPGDWLDSAEALRGGRRSAPADELTPALSLSRNVPAGSGPIEQPAVTEGAGPVDYSLFVGRSAAPQIQVSFGDIIVGGGAEPGAAGAEVAAEIERRVREVLSRLAAVEGDLYDPRFHSQMTAHDLGRQKERV